jgi:hypothetical protein
MSRREGGGAIKFKYDSILYTGGNGFGSTNTRIRKYSDQRIYKSTGAFTVANDATDGFSVTIKKAGLYVFGRWDTGVSDGFTAGISINSSQLTTDFINITDADQLCLCTYGQVNFHGMGGTSRYLDVGDVIRPHGDTRDNTTAGSDAGFFLTKLEIW